MKNINLRLDDQLHAELKDAARKNHRSLQQQIIWQLEAPYIRHHSERKAVHHIDGDPYNNDPANLALMDAEENTP